MICVRYRDVPPLMASLLQLLFFISPIIWIPSQIKGGELFVELNPVAYLLAITRDPIMESRRICKTGRSGRRGRVRICCHGLCLYALPLAGSLLVLSIRHRTNCRSDQPCR